MRVVHEGRRARRRLPRRHAREGRAGAREVGSAPRLLDRERGGRFAARMVRAGAYGHTTREDACFPDRDTDARVPGLMAAGALLRGRSAA